MTDLYMDRGNTRAVITSTVADIAAPTLAEITGGTDLTALLLPDGLGIDVQDITRQRIPWRGTMAMDTPTRTAVSITLQGYKRLQTGANTLWDLAATFRATAYLVVRRGVPGASAWAAGQDVEVYGFRYGHRRHVPPGVVSAATCTVPLYPWTFDLGAEVVA